MAAEPVNWYASSHEIMICVRVDIQIFGSNFCVLTEETELVAALQSSVQSDL